MRSPPEDRAAETKNKPKSGTGSSDAPGPKPSAFWSQYIDKQKSTALSKSTSPSHTPPLKDESKSKKNAAKVLSKKLEDNEKRIGEYRKRLRINGNLILLLFFTEKRVQGRDYNWTYIFAMKNREDPRKKDYYVLSLLLYQCLLGALGGIAVGFQTRFLSPNRFGQPNVPFPTSWNLPLTRGTAALGIKTSSMIWRMTKRGVISGILFDNIDRKVEMNRNFKRDWKNTAIAGAICGSFFGIRGGFQGPFKGAVTFGVLGALGGYLFINPPSSSTNGAGGSWSPARRWSP